MNKPQTTDELRQYAAHLEACIRTATTDKSRTGYEQVYIATWENIEVEKESEKRNDQ